MSELSRREFLGAAAGAAVLLGHTPATAQAAASVSLTDSAAIAEAVRLGHACHAFEHLGAFGMQAEAAAACGATVIYATGIGGDGYEGLPAADEWQRRLDAARAYTEKAKGLGIPVVLGYLCATSIVGLDDFDAGWTPEFRAKFKTPPREWLQEDHEGNDLPSWYQGAYRPACMNHPDWRAYQKEMVRFQIETGHGGIFFDNPTVHPKGCYCDHCMAAFAEFLKTEKVDVPAREVAALRKLAVERKSDFRRFRTTIARDFLAEMRAFARTLDPDALITANNSTNSPEVLYSQCNLYGYSPYEMSKAEDFVVIEDMSHQPRTTDDGKVFEYGPTYRQLKALCHGKPLVVCTIAEADYHTPPNLMRLAMAEAAANQATYMVWSTWPEEHRARLSAAARRQVDFLRQNAHTYVGTHLRRDAALFLPMRGWLDSDKCRASEHAAALSRENIQYIVFCEDEFSKHSRGPNVLIGADTVLTQQEQFLLSTSSQAYMQIDTPSDNWLAGLVDDRYRAVTIEGAPRVRAYVHDAKDATYVHLLNLDVRKRSSFTDEIVAVTDLHVRVNLQLILRGMQPETRTLKLDSVELLTADDNTTRGALPFTMDESSGYLTLTIPILEVAAILAIKLG